MTHRPFTERIRSAAVGLLFVAAANSVLADVSALDCGLITPNIPNQFPAWDDGVSGFSNPGYYATIQLADIDGDKQAELLARGPAGMLANHFDKDHGIWVSMTTPLTALSDKQGWTRPYYYLTIQTADIDGDGRQELLARGALGIYVFSYSPNSGTWTELAPVSGARPFPDADPATGNTDWTQPQYYSTVQLADIDGDGAAELLGRGVNGIAAYAWDKTRFTWMPLEENSEYFNDSGGSGKPEYYSTIQLADIDGDRTAELLGRNANGMAVFRWDKTKGTQGGWALVVDNSTAFSDTGGWNQPQYYSTIQLADIDADGQAELLGRGIGGMYTYHWNKEGKSWNQLGAVSTSFTDAGGWDQPQYYATIQLADIDGDGKAELAGRGTAGILSYAWNDARNAWTQLSNLPDTDTAAYSPPWSDSAGWNVASSYATLQAADVDGDGKAGLIGKADDGIATWRYSGANGIFVPTLLPGFPAFTASQKAAYTLVSQIASKELVGVTEDIRGQYANTLNGQDDWARARNRIDALTNTPPPAGTSQDDWNSVVTALYQEADYVRLANVWFDNLGELFTQTAILENAGGGTVGFVAGYLNLPSAGNNTNVILNDLSLAFQFVGALAGLIPGLGEAAGIVSSVAGLASTAIATGLAATPGPTSIAVQVQQLEAQLIDTQTRAQAANVCLKKSFVSNYGLLTALAKPISSLSAAWDDTLNTAMASAGRRGYELSAWQTLTPVKWEVDANFGYPTEQISCNFPDNPTASYPENPTDPNDPPSLWAYFLPGNDGGINARAFIVPDQNCTEAPPVDALRRLFLPANPDGITGSLGVPLSDLHCGYNGWAIPGSLTYATCNQFASTPASVSERKQAQKQQAQQRRAGNAFATRQINALMRAVRKTVAARGKAKRALQTALMQPLNGALRYVKRMKRGQEAAYGEFAAQQLHFFNMRLRAHSRQIDSQRAAEYIAKAHQIRARLKEVDMPQILAAIPAGKR